jgi:hypothetical protein
LLNVIRHGDAADAEGYTGGVGKDRTEGRIVHRPRTLSELRLLFGRYAEDDELPDVDAHRAVRGCPHRINHWSQMIEDPLQKTGRLRQLCCISIASPNNHSGDMRKLTSAERP